MKLFVAIIAGLFLFSACSKVELEHPEIVDPTEEESVVPGAVGSYPLKLRADKRATTVFEPIIFDLVDSTYHGDNANILVGLKFDHLDSLIWSVDALGKSMHLIHREPGSSGMSLLWDHRFYLAGAYTVYLRGYDKGRLVVNDSVDVNIELPRGKDFLNFKWADAVGTNNSTTGFSNSEVDDYSFICFAESRNGIQYGILRPVYQLIGRNSPSSPSADWHDGLKPKLIGYMDQMYGHATYTSPFSDIKKIYESHFVTPLNGAGIDRIWTTPTTNIALLVEPSPGRYDAKYYIWAEPIRQPVIGQ